MNLSLEAAEDFLSQVVFLGVYLKTETTDERMFQNDLQKTLQFTAQVSVMSVYFFFPLHCLITTLI